MKNQEKNRDRQKTTRSAYNRTQEASPYSIPHSILMALTYVKQTVAQKLSKILTDRYLFLIQLYYKTEHMANLKYII